MRWWAIQRVPKDHRLKEVGDYLRKGELVFFPETVGFNLRDSSQIRFKRIDDFKDKLRKNLEKHFKLQP